MHFRATLYSLASIAFAGAVSAAPPANVTIEQATVEREDGHVIVRWVAMPSDSPIDVFIGSRLISNDDRDGRHELSSNEAAQRPLVKLVTPDGHALVTAERALPLQGGRNFRDLGGYRTADGKQVKWGRVFRSGTMTSLTDSDYALLSSLGIRVVCDFRSDGERTAEPTNWQAHGEPIAYRTRSYDMSSGASASTALGKGPPTAESLRAMMLQSYGNLPYEHAESYRVMFKSLAAGELPLAFNCSAGKDRTGVAAALLLTLLGVPRETIVADYALSDKLVDYQSVYSAPTPAGAEKDASRNFLTRLPPEVRAPVLRSDPDYVRAALQAIEQREGSIPAYFERVLTLTPAEQAHIRALLLEPLQQ